MVTPTPEPSHRLARHIAVSRDPQNGSVRIFIDGELVPWMATGEGVTVETPFGQPGKVTFSLTAERITVDDQFLVGAADALGLDHDHEDTPAAASVPAPAPDRTMPERADCTKTARCLLTDGHGGPCL